MSELSRLTRDGRARDRCAQKCERGDHRGRSSRADTVSAVSTSTPINRRIAALNKIRLWALVVAAIVLIALITVASNDGPRAEFWRIAVPGILTGIGTLALAGVTVWSSSRQRLDNEHLRAEQAAAISSATGAEALRDARKVFGICRAPQGDDAQLFVVNVSPDPIFYVAISGNAKSPISGADMTWLHGVHQEGVGYVLPNSEHPFNGRWSESLQVYWADRAVPVTVEWTDGRGNRWVRRGFTEPEALDPCA